MKIAVLLLGLTLYLSAFGQLNRKWSGTTAGTGATFDNVSYTNTAIDAEGNLYNVGIFVGSYDFDPGVDEYILSSVSYDSFWTPWNTFIQKLSPDGELLWAVALNNNLSVSSEGYNTCYSKIVFDTGGNLILGGSFYGTTDFDPGPSETLKTAISPIYDDGYLLKLDKDGNFIWVKIIECTDYMHIDDLDLDSDDNIICAIQFGSSPDVDPGPGTYYLTGAGSWDVGIVKYNIDGDFIWAKTFGSPDVEQSFEILLDANDEIVIGGDFYDPINFSTSGTTATEVSNGSYDVYLAKYDSDGNLLWVRTFGGTGVDISSGIAMDNANNIYSHGYFSSTVDFDPGASSDNVTSQGLADGFISKFNPDGDFEWVRTLGGDSSDYISDIFIDEANYMYACGSFDSNVDFDPGSDSAFSTTDSNRNNYTLLLDADGQYIDHLSFNCVGFSYGSQIVKGNGVIYSIGGFEGDIDLGINETDIYSSSINSERDAFLVAICENPPPVNAGVDLEVCAGDPVTLTASGADTYVWTPAIADGVEFNSLDSTTNYVVDGVDVYGCRNADTVAVIIKSEAECTEYMIFNAFTPNSDGKNDFLEISGIEEYENNEIIIYNRWGDEVYGVEGYDNELVKWDGIAYSGKLLNPGTYYIVIYVDNEPFDSGYIQIIY